MSYKVPLTLVFVLTALAAQAAGAEEPPAIDFNRQIRPLLANTCYQCHGPDEAERQADLRLDTEEGVLGAIQRHQPDASELIRRVTSQDPDDRMPPPDSGKTLSIAEIQTLTQWVRQGAPYARHWSYLKPHRPTVPEVDDPAWSENPIDRFVLKRLQREGLPHAPQADRYTLVRRVALDLTGLPPTADEVEQFLRDSESGAYERLVDRLLSKPAYGEHWARMWLDLARYADSCGYADDPARTIWAYRDYVIRAFNDNKPFDQFTIEQLAGDLLPSPSNDQLIATAFHRNTLTNNEGGTNDEEFRNVAVVDRVNTTLAVWMGTTISCSQCHNHKYDPLSQEEFFRLFAFFNSSADADRPDESPVLEIWSDVQLQQKAGWQKEIAELERTVTTTTPALAAAQERWEADLATPPQWQTLRPVSVRRTSDAPTQISEDGAVFVPSPAKVDTYVAALQLPPATAASASAQSPRQGWTALRVETLPHESLPNGGAGHGGGDFVVTRVRATATPAGSTRPAGRFVRIELPGQDRILSLAEVQVFSGDANVALSGTATQSSTAHDGPATLAIDNNTNGEFPTRSTTHSATEANPWWEVDLAKVHEVDRIQIWNRTDNGLQSRLADARVLLLDEDRNPVWEEQLGEPPNPSKTHELSGARPVPLASAWADLEQSGFPAASVLESQEPAPGWAVGSQFDQPHRLTLVLEAPLDLHAGGHLTLTLEQQSPRENHVLGHFRITATTSPNAAAYARTPASILALINTPVGERTAEQRAELARHYLAIAPELQAQRDRLAGLKKELADARPATTVPVMRELPPDQRRKTHVQLRGNFLALGKEVTPGVPAVFPSLPASEPVNRWTLAQWVMDAENPLTGRVLVNRYWEAIFGIGLVRTSEEFGAQGELPSHPELLDWLAVEFQESGWNLKRLLKLMVTSAAYCQSSRVSAPLLERDPDNRWLARGPRFRLSAEMIRDQALDVGGLLSARPFGPPVRPPQPTLGVSAAFGSGIDWKTSDGEDRHRRGLYTLWRRSNPYPSMAAFDAPNREVCTLRRDRTNTPLQALVTLNDPVYIEAAQGLARRAIVREGTLAERLDYAFRRCLIRPPAAEELDELARLYERSREHFLLDSAKAERMATQPFGPAPPGIELADLAAWTVVGNVLLNLDETLMKP